MMTQIIATIVQAILVLLIAPFSVGMVRFAKARLQGRKGASPFLPYFTILTLLKKVMVIPKASSWIFRFSPYMVLGSAVLCAVILPLVFSGAALAPLSDFLVFGGILVVGSAFLVMGGMDTGSAFGGMGSSREMTIAALLEPVTIVAFAAVSLVTGQTAIDGMVRGNMNVLEPHFILFIASLLFISLAENARYPVDNPATHLELTMVHEAMILEYSGKYLAMVELASAIKLTVFSLLIANFLFPFTLVSAAAFSLPAIFVGALVAVLKVSIVMALLGLLETMLVKMRFYRMSEYFSVAFVIAFMAMLTALLSTTLKMALDYYLLFSILTLVSVVMLFGRVRLKAILRYYSWSSLFIAGIALGLLPLVGSEERFHLWLFAAFTVITKVWAVPFVINRIGQVKKSLTNLPSFVRPGKSYFMAVILLLVTYFAMKNIAIIGLVKWSPMLYAAVSLIVLGIAMMIVKRNIFSEIIGLLVIENGIAVFVLATVGSLPIMIEFGIFGVTVATAYILSILSAQIGKLYGSTDTEDLRNLTE